MSDSQVRYGLSIAPRWRLTRVSGVLDAAGDLRGDRGPVAGDLRGPRPAKARKHRRNDSRRSPCFRGFSPVFAGLRKTLTNRPNRTVFEPRDGRGDRAAAWNAVAALSGSRHRAAGIGGNPVLLATQQPTALLGEGEAGRCGRRELRRRPGLQRGLYRRGLRDFDRHSFSLADEADGP